MRPLVLRIHRRSGSGGRRRLLLGGYKIYPEADPFSTAVIRLECVDKSCYSRGAVDMGDYLTGMLRLKQGVTACEDRAAPEIGTNSYVFPLEGYVKVTSIRTHGGGGANDLGLR